MSIETQTNSDFCWTGAGDRYCILNSVDKSAVAMVKATCTWKPKGGEGGGGSGGAPLPVLIGTGTAIAIAQRGTYWNTAGGVNVLALGMGTVVKALKDQGAPADSEWTCTSNQLTIFPCGDIARVTADLTGIVTSASAWDANVHSESLDYKGLSDDEPFTVVSVASISAKPAVVCVGNSNIAYTITTAPTGFEHMVRYTPADTSTPGVKEVVATCGLSAATCTVTVLKVESETVSPVPADRTRTTLGIAERVTLTVVPSITVNWSVTGGGSVSPINGNSTTFTASKSPCLSVVHAQVGGADCIKIFTVIAPSSITSAKKADVGHGTVGTNKIGAYTTYDITVFPTNVSFHWAELRENIPNHVWTWPNGDSGGISMQTPTWSVGYANDTVDNISSGPYPIGKIYNGTNYVDFSYKAVLKEEYANESSSWTEFLPKEDTLTEYRGSDQKCRQTHMGAPGEWQGPWQ